MRIVDLFCGCGGFSLGADRAGLPASLAVDIDPILTHSFRYNHTKTKLALADLARASGRDIEREAGGSVTGLSGGPPCQAFSEIGRRRRDDPRRSLLGHFFRLVRELRPAFFVMENVRGLTYADARPALDTALDTLDGRYQIVGPTILDASDFGAATRRSRLFVIGYDPRRCDPLTAEDLESAKSRGATVREAINDLANAIPLGESDAFDLWQCSTTSSVSAYASGLRSTDSTFTGNRKTKHSFAVMDRFRRIEQGGVDLVGRHPRLAWDGQCPTLRAGTGNDRGKYQSVRPIHPEEARVITVREAARLQGFPDHFRFHPTVWHSFRMIGNSVSPFVSKAIFSLIARRTEPGLPSAIAAAE